MGKQVSILMAAAVFQLSSVALAPWLFAKPFDPKDPEDMQKAKDAVVNSGQYLNLSDNEKALFRDEVVPHSSFFVVPSPDAGNVGFRVDDASLRHYLSFSATKLMQNQEDGRHVVTLCYRIEAEPHCEACAALAQGLVKYLPKRLNRRGFEARELPASALPENLTAESPMLSTEKLNEIASHSGCLQKLFVAVSANPAGNPVADSFMEIKDQGKTVYTAKSSVAVSKDLLLTSAAPSKKPAPPGPGPVLTALVKSTAQLFSNFGQKLASLAVSEAGPAKRLLVEKFPSYGAYVTFKRKLVDSIEGLTSLDERTMAPRSVEFMVQGSVSLEDLDKKLVDTIGADPVIESHHVEGDVLKVVLK